ncbi:MAG: hypothetical protein HZB33_14265 [Nitrospirae bacterium]|nr:hypothetical protein [Nitrospirota bacterium]
MTSQEYIKQQIASGYDIHLSCGVWWIKSAPYFYRPANPLQVIGCGQASPKKYRALLGYKHLAPTDDCANQYWSIMVLNNERLRSFGMQSISSSKRARVRKGLKLTRVKRIESIESVIDDMKEICIAQKIRTGYGKPVEYYRKQFKHWKESRVRQFQSTAKEYWGAFCDESLIAFMNIIQIDNTMLIDNAKSHTDHLDKCPNDALLFTVLDYCRQIQGCNRVIFGEWSGGAASLNDFKAKYGFERVDMPVYAKYNPIVKLLKNISKRR